MEWDTSPKEKIYVLLFHKCLEIDNSGIKTRIYVALYLLARSSSLLDALVRNEKSLFHEIHGGKHCFKSFSKIFKFSTFSSRGSSSCAKLNRKKMYK